jgi:hypothetical protein
VLTNSDSIAQARAFFMRIIYREEGEGAFSARSALGWNSVGGVDEDIVAPIAYRPSGVKARRGLAPQMSLFT